MGKQIKLLFVTPPSLAHTLNDVIAGLRSTGTLVTVVTNPFEAIDMMRIGSGFDKCVIVASGVIMCREIAHTKNVLIPTTYFWQTTEPELENVELIKLTDYAQIWPGAN